MALKNSIDSFGSISILLHWLMAVLIMGLIIIGFLMTSLAPGPQKAQVYELHKAIGFIVLLMTMFRWYWMLSNVRPAPLPTWSHGELSMAFVSKWLLMLLMLMMSMSGALYTLASGYDINVFGLLTISGFAEPSIMIKDFTSGVHEIGAYVIAGLVILHIVAVLKHHLIRKDNTLNRMLGH